MVIEYYFQFKIISKNHVKDSFYVLESQKKNQRIEHLIFKQKIVTMKFKRII